MIEKHQINTTVKNTFDNQEYVILYIDEIGALLKDTNKSSDRMYLKIVILNEYYTKVDSIREKFADFLRTDILNENKGHFYTLSMTDKIFSKFNVVEKTNNKSNIT